MEKFKVSHLLTNHIFSKIQQFSSETAGKQSLSDAPSQQPRFNTSMTDKEVRKH